MGNATRPFYLTPEAPAYAALASFYGTPVVSMRNALWRSGTPNANGLITLNAVAKDGSTPLDAGHRSIVDMLAYYTQRTAEDLVLLPYGEYDRNSMARDLPERSVYSGEFQDLASHLALCIPVSTRDASFDVRSLLMANCQRSGHSQSSLPGLSNGRCHGRAPERHSSGWQVVRLPACSRLPA